MAPNYRADDFKRFKEICDTHMLFWPNDLLAREMERRGWPVGVSDKAIDKLWREQDGVIYFSVIPDGTTGEEWIKRLENKGFRISDYAKQVLRSPDFKPTSGVTTEIAVLKGMLFADNDRITKKIRAEAGKRKLMKPNAETAIIIREKFTDEELKAMGLWWIVVMHEPIKDSVGDPYLLDAYRFGHGRWLGACYGSPGGRWLRGCGFAFAVSPQ